MRQWEIGCDLTAGDQIDDRPFYGRSFLVREHNDTISCFDYNRLRTVSDEHKEYLLKTYYDPYHQEFEVRGMLDLG